jgi:simple sugar transport system substrate-binding protein
LVAGAALVVCSCTTGSSGQTSPSPASGKQLTVYFATIAIGNGFFGTIHKGADQAAAETGVKVVWTEGQQFDMTQAVQRMNTAIAAKPDVMVVTDAVPASMNPVIEKAKQAGIVVIDINAQDTSAKPPYLFYIGASEYESGKAAAQAILDASSPAPKRAICAIQLPGAVQLEQRCQGFHDVLSAAGVAVDKVDISANPTDVAVRTKAYFTSHPDATAIFTLTAGPEAFDPVLKVLRDGGLNKKVQFVTNDLSPSAFSALQAGDLLAAIDQQQYLQGYLAVVWANLYMKYKMFPPTGQVLTGPSLVTKDNYQAVQQLNAQGIR